MKNSRKLSVTAAALAAAVAVTAGVAYASDSGAKSTVQTGGKVQTADQGKTPPLPPLRVLFSKAPDPHFTADKHDYFAWAVMDNKKRTLTIYGHSIKDLTLAPHARILPGTRPGSAVGSVTSDLTYFAWADQDRTKSTVTVTTNSPELPGLGL